MGIDFARTERLWDDWGYWGKVHCPIENSSHEHRWAETFRDRQNQYHYSTCAGVALTLQALDWFRLCPAYKARGLHGLDPGVWTNADRGWDGRAIGLLSPAEPH